jgi:processive 1,2-diacylglycerol beta-glucosyltransferase
LGKIATLNGAIHLEASCMTKILILYASLGSGHVSAAAALSEAFERFPGVTVQCEDALAHANPLYRSIITRTYEQLSENAPFLYKAFYEGSDVGDLERSLENNLAWAKLERIFFRQLAQLVQAANPDIMVCVQQIPSRLLQLLDPEDELLIPQYVVVTDAIVHSTWINRGVKGYFLANEVGKSLLKQRGISPDILHVTGIPIRLSISEPKDKLKTRMHHNWPTQMPLVTLMGGGLNPKRVRTMVQDCLNSPLQFHLVIVAGRSEDLLTTLEDLESSPTVHLEKWAQIDSVDDLIVASDIVITKAGGLITSEILARGTPMVIVDPIPGQEEQNADLIAAAGAGIQLRLPEMVAPAIQFLLNHPDRLTEMREWAFALGRPRAALDVAESVLRSQLEDEFVPSLTTAAADCKTALRFP